jgi:DNA-binding MarR family transcriptional regulator
MSETSVPSQQDDLLHVLRETILAEVRADAPDLSLRQTVVLLTVYLTNEPQTVRGLAAHLNVGRPVITRVLDRLGELGLVRRKVDPADRRSVIAQRTPDGATMVERLKVAMATGRGCGYGDSPASDVIRNYHEIVTIRSERDSLLALRAKRG